MKGLFTDVEMNSDNVKVALNFNLNLRCEVIIFFLSFAVECI